MKRSIPNKKQAPQNRRKRCGLLSAEFALTFPIFLVMLFGLFEFSLLFSARGSVVESCRAGTRKATLPGVTEEAIREEVLRTLKPRLRDGAIVELSRGEYSGDDVRVTVSVPMHNASPDLLWPIGYTLRDQFLTASNRMVRE